MQNGEFLTGLHLPPHRRARSAGSYNKLGRTKIGDISIVSVAVNCGRRDDGRWPGGIAIGAAGPTPLRAPEAEAALAQDSHAGGRGRGQPSWRPRPRGPIDDIRGSAAYRKAMVRVLARRGIESRPGGA